MALIFEASSGGSLQGTVRVPGDKSISHRSIMLGALADGLTEVSGFLEGEDTLATLHAFQSMGVRVERPAGYGVLHIHGVGMQGLREPSEPLDLGNSGTSMRLMTGLLVGQAFDTVLVGDPSLSQRPMRRVIDPLAQMGALIEASATGTAPLRVRGGHALRGIAYRLPMASAQVKSALLLAGLYAAGRTTLTEPASTRDHTERMLMGFGYDLEQHGSSVSLTGGGRLRATRIDIPGDLSSAAFFLVGASIAPGSDLLIEHVGINPTRTGILHILKAMGANIQIMNERIVGGESVADLRVRHAPLHGIAIPPEWVPLAIDEFPALFIAAACAEGDTTLIGAAELRVKESDRIQTMADGLRAVGVDATPTPDGMVIRGGAGSGGMHGAEIDSHGDHRIAMAFAIAALRARDTVRIVDCANVNTSFPGFVTLASRAGLSIRAFTA